MTITPPDPGDRSDGILDHGSILFEPAHRSEPPQARSEAAQVQPEAKAKSASRYPWHNDPEISWYGPGLYGNGTACGLKLTRKTVGVAHRTLPCGTLVQFRNAKTGAVVTAEVIDRGPFVSGRQFDLSHGLCVQLDHCYTGPIQWRYAPGS
jgi:rare lipoprotein A (peptidoglycan hydrolase)